MLLGLEIAGTVFGLLCVWLTVRRNIWCWPTGLIQVVLFCLIFHQVKLYSDLILHVVYVGMQVYGWWYWLHGGKDRSKVRVSKQKGSARAAWLAFTLTAACLWGFGMSRWTDASVPYGDAFTTVASLAAQWMLARKQLESWLYWIAVDVVAIGIYFHKELYVTAGLYAVFLGLATWGFVSWLKSIELDEEEVRE